MGQGSLLTALHLGVMPDKGGFFGFGLFESGEAAGEFSGPTTARMIRHDIQEASDSKANAVEAADVLERLNRDLTRLENLIPRGDAIIGPGRQIETATRAVQRLRDINATIRRNADMKLDRLQKMLERKHGERGARP